MRITVKKLALILAVFFETLCFSAEEDLGPSKVFIDNSCLKKNQQTPKEGTSKTEKVSCPSQDFAKFLKQFVNDEATQRQFTQFPLLSKGMDSQAEPEPKQYEEKLSRKQVKFPIIPSCKRRQQVPLEIRLVSASESLAEIKIQKPDTDWLTYYVFKKDKKIDCWKLTEIKDWSL